MEWQNLLEMKENSDDEAVVVPGSNQRNNKKEINTQMKHLSLSKMLYITAIFSFISAFGIAGIFVLGYQTNKNFWRFPLLDHNKEQSSVKNISVDSMTSNPCLTPGCIKAAASILSNIDESVEPCTNFYQFACGGWLNNHPIPENKGAVSVFGLTQDHLNKQLKELLERKLNGSEPPFVSMVKNMYDACMDLDSIEKANSKPLKDVLKVLGGWPVVEGRNWNASAFDWIEMLKSFRRLGYNHRILLDLSIRVDPKSNSSHIISLGQADLGMPDRAYLIAGLNDSTTAAYFKLMLKSAEQLGANKVASENELMKSLNFEMKLANFSLPRAEFRNTTKTYNKFTVQQLQQIVPQVAWLKYLNALQDNELSADEPLIVNDPDFIYKFGKLISTTDKRVIANYMLWRVVFGSLKLLSQKWRRLLHEYTTTYTGIDQQSPRWEICLSYVTGSLAIAMSSYYVKNFFDRESKEAGLKLYSYIHKEFLENLEKVDWMEKETKQKAKEKVKAIKPYSGYPDELLNDTLIIRLYSELTITNNSFFNNVLNLRKWSADSEFSLLRRPYRKRRWPNYSRVVTVNAYYRIIENSIEFLAGILQKEFFDKNRPHYMNFGAIGFVLAHELTHSLDDLGRQFDKDGNNVHWWDKTTEEKFKKKVQCIIDQFSNFTAENGMKINGLKTEGENIADNGGFKLAYKAYQSWIKDNGPEQKLPGLKYSPSQLFWISAANIWCVKFRPETLKLRIITGSHTPDNFRIIGGFANLAEFSQEFNCSLDSQMNSKHKCTIW